MTTETEVQQASDQFYEALNQMAATGNAGAVIAEWSQRQTGSTMHPIGGREIGRDQVTATWKQAAPAFSEGKVSAHDVVVIPLCDDVAYTAGTERIEGKVGGEMMHGEWRATNIYRREDGDWKIVHHHADASPEMTALLARLQAQAVQTTA
jgi:ketosteroid isomerase-like protein